MEALSTKVWLRPISLIMIAFSPLAQAVPEITEFWLLDTQTDTRIQRLESYDSLSLPVLPGQLSIEAVANGDTESVIMQIDHVDNSTENLAPYALGGDNSGDFNPVTALKAPGWITISAKPYAGNNANGISGTKVNLPLFIDRPDFFVTNSSDVGDYDPGDGHCSITKPKVISDYIDKQAHLPLPSLNNAVMGQIKFQLAEEQKATQAPRDINITRTTVDHTPLQKYDWGLVSVIGTGCTLRAAVEEANALPGNQRILIDGSKGPFKLVHGQLEITEGVTIKGHELPLIDAQSDSRIFYVDGQGNDIIVNLSGLDMARGVVSSSARGGVISVDNNALVQMSDSIVREGRANFGGGIYTQGGGDLTVWRSAIFDNVAGTPESFGGGGVTQRGGGIYNLEGVVKIYDSAIYDNLAVRGGGLSNKGGLMRIENSSIVDNEALSIGGGIENHNNGDDQANLHLSFVTISGNEAGTSNQPPVSQRSGGGLYNTARVYMASSILAENTDAWYDGNEHHAPDCFSPILYDFKSYRHNVVGVLNENCSFTDYSWGNHGSIQFGSEVSPLDPGLNNFRQKRNQRAYYRLTNGSVAIDGGASQAASLYPCADDDMRGHNRPKGSACDIGAIESY